MVGDDDEVTLEHAIATYRALPDGELIVVPGTSHGLLVEKPELCNRVILASSPPVSFRRWRRSVERRVHEDRGPGPRTLSRVCSSALRPASSTLVPQQSRSAGGRGTASTHASWLSGDTCDVAPDCSHIHSALHGRLRRSPRLRWKRDAIEHVGPFAVREDGKRG